MQNYAVPCKMLKLNCRENENAKSDPKLILIKTCFLRKETSCLKCFCGLFSVLFLHFSKCKLCGIMRNHVLTTILPPLLLCSPCAACCLQNPHREHVAGRQACAGTNNISSSSVRISPQHMGRVRPCEDKGARRTRLPALEARPPPRPPPPRPSLPWEGGAGCVAARQRRQRPGAGALPGWGLG